MTINGGKINRNSSDGYGGALYLSGKAIMKIRGTEISENHSAKGGGLMYITTSGTTAYIYGGTTSFGNTSDSGDNCIQGNSQKAILNVNKEGLKDFSYSGKLTVNYISEVMA